MMESRRGIAVKRRRLGWMAVASIAALLGAGTVTFLFAVLLRRRQIIPHVPFTPPEGGEREGEFELFIGS